MTGRGWYVHMQNQANDSIFLSRIIYGLNAILIFYCTTTHLVVAGSSDKTQGDLKVAFCCFSSRLRCSPGGSVEAAAGFKPAAASTLPPGIGPLAGRYNGCDRNDPPLTSNAEFTIIDSILFPYSPRWGDLLWKLMDRINILGDSSS